MDDKEKFFELSQEYEQLKDKLEVVRKEMEEALVQIGYETYFQDPNTLVVYKVVMPRGQFVPFTKISYERTTLPGETRGTLSKKEAESKGFVLG